jgi:3-methyladenine DNA glycosylase/8-oxoguanine DNA glycosylase
VYLRDLAERLANGRLDLERLRKLDDDAARAPWRTLAALYLYRSVRREA